MCTSCLVFCMECRLDSNILLSLTMGRMRDVQYCVNFFVASDHCVVGTVYDAYM